jgi:glutamate dehydrogenase
MDGDTLMPAAHDAAQQAIAVALIDGALPGETDGFTPEAHADAAAFVMSVAAQRTPGKPAIAIESISGEGVQRRTRLAIVNDDMPFLVDSIASALAAHQIDIHRLLHPVLAVRRDGEGRLTAVLDGDASGERRESMIYIEGDRVDAKLRRALETDLTATLDDVRVAVEDWPRLQVALREAAQTLPDGEGAALLRWFLERHFTLLGARIEARDGSASAGLGILRDSDGAPLWLDAVRDAAFRWFEEGGEAPLVLKSDRVATVHRRAPIDLLIVPVRSGGQVTGLSIHGGLWTSAALRSPSDKVPVLRARLAGIEGKYGFNPSGHAGKALRHALSALPHDVIVSFSPACLEWLALTAMSLADRPRPKLLLAPGPLQRHLFAFVWLPREALSTRQREAIRDMLEAAAAAKVSSWALDLGEGDLALIRYTLDLAPGAAIPDAAALDAGLEAMLRGWAPALELKLGETIGTARAARLTLDWAEAFPADYRARSTPEIAAADTLRLTTLEGPAGRAVRIYNVPSDGEARLRIKIYRLGGLIPLSEAVPVFENFGFTVLAEMPIPLKSGEAGYIHEFGLQASDAQTVTALLARAGIAEAAIAAVLEGQAENDAFNALIVGAGLDPRDGVLLRAWFRYLRQTGLPYGLQTVAATLGRAPQVVRALIALFDARHDPKGHGDEDQAKADVDAALAEISSIEDDRILRRFGGVVAAILRTNAFAPGGTRGAGVQARIGERAGSAQAAAVARNLGLFAAGRGHPSARRADRPRRPALVRPARRFPHRNPGPDEGTGGEECRDRADRRKGRLLPQAIAAVVEPRCVAGRGDRELPHLHPRVAVGDRQSGRGRGGPPREGARARRRRSLFRGRGRQGHRHFLRRRQCARDRARLLAGRCLRQRRQQRLRP